MPGGIPFEPDWVMQALGMTTLPPNNQYSVKIDEDAHLRLSRPSTTPNGCRWSSKSSSTATRRPVTSRR